MQNVLLGMFNKEVNKINSSIQFPIFCLSEIVYIYVVVSDAEIDHPCRFLNNINIQGKDKQTKNTL